MLIDLHTHSTESDGALSPHALLERARQRGVTHLSITDHDTVSAYQASLPGGGPVLIPGIELSTRWRKTGVHVVGLNVDVASKVLSDGIQQQQQARRERAGKIAARLMKTGIDDPLPAVQALATGGNIGRPHFAQHLVDIGKVRDLRQAFRQYLGDGKPGDIRQHWADLETVVGWIAAAGGVAVLAHPAHYHLTMTRLRALLSDFRACGGRAMEVVSGRQDDAVTRKMAALADEFGLLASCGSDFHSPAARRAELGGFPPLPARCRPVWTCWQ